MLLFVRIDVLLLILRCRMMRRYRYLREGGQSEDVVGRKSRLVGGREWVGCVNVMVYVYLYLYVTVYVDAKEWIRLFSLHQNLEQCKGS